ncbi:MAG: BadF/BadG/BcrA/BcrD ATPase family protein [Vicinamibacterales bacterium]
MFVLGLDAGGTKTVCLLADGDGQVLAEARRGGANLQAAGELEVEKVLHDVMEEALAACDGVPSAICLGIAGVDRPGDAVVVAGIMKRIGYKARVLVVNDALVALEAGAPASAGVVVIAGTGSIAYGRNDRNEAARAGGWGYMLGDEGSGYWIGRAALRAVLRQADRRGPNTELTGLLLAYFAVERAQDLIHHVYQGTLKPGAIAALAQCVYAGFQHGDEVSIGILREAADQLESSAISVARRLDLAGTDFPFVLAGGMFRAIRWLHGELDRRLTTALPGSRTALLGVEPAVGAIRLALADVRGGYTPPRYRDA